MLDVKMLKLCEALLSKLCMFLHLSHNALHQLLLFLHTDIWVERGFCGN